MDIPAYAMALTGLIQPCELQDDLRHSRIILFARTGRHARADLWLRNGQNRRRDLMLHRPRRGNLQILREELRPEPGREIAGQDAFAADFEDTPRREAPGR